MTTPALPAPIVDYTSRDFLSIRQDLFDLALTRFPEWTSRSANDFGVVLMELFAYMADGLHYYADRVANESFLATAVQRSSVLQFADLLDYTPSGNAAAQVVLTFANSTASPLVVPALTQVVSANPSSNPADNPVTFETSADLIVPANSTATVTANEGVTVSNESLGTSDGTYDQHFTLFRTSVINGSVVVTVNEGTPTVWSYVSHLLDASGTSKVYTIKLQSDDTTSVVFGDGASGKIPNQGSTITATYRIGGGTRGNVPANTLTRIITAVPAGITVNNQSDAAGGADSESTDSIRLHAPASLQSLQRAVTLNDFANLAVTVPSVAKARATSSTFNSVQLYIAPEGGGGVVGGVDTTAFAAIKAACLAYINDRKPVTTTVSVLSPTYVAVNITVTINLLPTALQTATSNAVALALTNLLSFDNVIFGDIISPTDVHTTTAQVDGVAYTTITLLDVGSGTGTGPVSLANNAIPIAGTITVNPVGGV